MKRRNAAAVLFLAVGLALGLLFSGVFNAPAPDLKASEDTGAAVQAASAVDTEAPAASTNREKLNELRDFAGKMETLFQTVADEVSPAVVLVEAKKTVRVRMPAFQSPFDQFFFGDPSRRRGPGREVERKQRGFGSGCILDAEGHILTNNHVIAGADELKVTLGDGREFDAEVVGTDEDTDVAVIQIVGDAKDLPTIVMGDSDQVKVGQWVLAIGNPFGLRHTVSAGIVSATGRTIGAATYESMIQTDAAINPGNSGGPLVNLHCEVIGINAAIVGRGGNIGIGFAIPINMAKDILDDLIAGRQVERGYLGLLPADVGPDMAEALGYDGAGGALVKEVLPDTPAAQEGLQAGDIVTEYEGRKVENANEFRRRVAETDPGTTVRLKVWRDGKEKAFRVKLADRATLPSKEDWLGLSVETLTPQKAQKLGRADLQGVIVTDVAPRSIAAQIGIAPDDVILRVNSRPFKTAREYRELLEKVKPGQPVALHVLVRRTGRVSVAGPFRRPRE